MSPWELARYIIDSKKDIDSIIFISQNVKQLSRLDIKQIINEKLTNFYINLRAIYDKTYSLAEKKNLKGKDKIFKETLYEADKFYAHKDDDYKKTPN